jgi:transposase InsO family protein
VFSYKAGPSARLQTTLKHHKGQSTHGGIDSSETDAWASQTPPEHPHRIHRLPEETVQKVLEVRRREGWCSETIAAYLKRQKIQVSSGSVHSILKQNQLMTQPYKPCRQRTYIRFQLEHPDSLWQADIKYLFRKYYNQKPHRSLNFLTPAAVYLNQ